MSYSFKRVGRGWVLGGMLALLPLAIYAKETPPQKHLLLLGGNVHGEDDRIYDESLVEMGEFFKNGRWSRRLWFGGASSRVRRLAEEKLGAPSAPFEIGNLQSQLALIDREIQEGKIKRGDQYLIVLDTHGGNSRNFPNVAGPNGQKIHPATDADPEFRKVFDVSELQPLLERLKKAGVRPALLDLSCFSGSSQQLADPRTCVISSADPESVSFPKFKRVLFSKFKEGKSLEQAFREARVELDYPTLPEISTEEGRKAAEQVRPLYRSLQFGEEIEAIVIPGWITDEVACEVPLSQDRAIESIRRFLKELEANPDLLEQLWSLSPWGNEGAVQRLKQKVSHYQRKLAEIVALKKKFQESSPDSDSNDTISGEAGLLLLRFQRLSEQMEDEAKAVGSAERQVYELLYDKYALERKASRPEPCREFTL